MIADLTEGAGDDGAERRERANRTAIATAVAQLQAALLDHKQAQLRLDNCRLAIEEAVAALRKARG